MSLITAVKHFRKTCLITDFPDEMLELGIPDGWANLNGKKWYLELQQAIPDFGGHQASFEILEFADAVIVFRLHQDQLPETEEWFFWAWNLHERIQQKMVQDAANRVYEEDGGAGFRVVVVSKSVQFDPQASVQYGRMFIRFSQYFT